MDFKQMQNGDYVSSCGNYYVEKHKDGWQGVFVHPDYNVGFVGVGKPTRTPEEAQANVREHAA